ncbi:dihydrofolate reductase family protein [Humibacter ginsenosidimutans]|uniref:Dihydrofolate reductase n=1 Tax=Humibacter ginsenosidimutans TaxID=2599293 RepID=A0A5B8M1P5_9MICO|nr:dihydrofolate reductase family protein [Humibacter ginsenosidimutans]QDZ13642.1 dihydrofolate reductase [Humibacter ginsenosidimutans]
MLIYSMTASADGFIADRDGGIDWSAPDDELFQAHLDEVRSLGAYLLGRRLYETMLVWETQPALSESESGAAFAETWRTLPKIVFSRSGAPVQGRARLAEKPLAEEIVTALETTDKPVSIGGAALAAAAIEFGFVDEFRLFRAPVVLGGGTPYFPPVPEQIRMRTLETRTFDSGVVYERYLRVSA